MGNENWISLGLSVMIVGAGLLFFAAFLQILIFALKAVANGKRTRL